MDTFKEAAKKYPDIETGDVIVDNCCMQLVRNPAQFDCLVLPNLYGNILTDLCAGLVGGLGFAPGANVGDNCAIFEAVHGSAPKYARLKKVNPSAVLMSGSMMLQWLKKEQAAELIKKSEESAQGIIDKMGVMACS
ncbi:MAG: isocitrate/isopropylmalate family dehydrogenase [Nitrospirota bacterium]